MIVWCSNRISYQTLVVSFNCNTTGVTGGAGAAKPSGELEFTQVYSEVHVAQFLFFCIVLCRQLFAFLFLFVFILAILLSELRITTFDYLVCILLF